MRCEAALSTPCPTDASFSLLLLSLTWSAVSPQRKVCSGRGFGVGQFSGPRACLLCHCPLESPQRPVTCGCSSHTGLCSSWVGGFEGPIFSGCEKPRCPPVASLPCIVCSRPFPREHSWGQPVASLSCRYFVVSLPFSHAISSFSWGDVEKVDKSKK